MRSKTIPVSLMILSMNFMTAYRANAATPAKPKATPTIETKIENSTARTGLKGGGSVAVAHAGGGKLEETGFDRVAKAWGGCVRSCQPEDAALAKALSATQPGDDPLAGEEDPFWSAYAAAEKRSDADAQIDILEGLLDKRAKVRAAGLPQWEVNTAKVIESLAHLENDRFHKPSAQQRARVRRLRGWLVAGDVGANSAPEGSARSAIGSFKQCVELDAKLPKCKAAYDLLAAEYRKAHSGEFPKDLELAAP